MAKRGIDDLVMLPKVSESDIVDNLKKRYDVVPSAGEDTNLSAQNDLIYTYIGPVLLSVNPYRDLGLVGEKVTICSLVAISGC